MKELMRDVCSLLRQGEDLVLATILSQEGSTPRKTAKMAIRRDGKIRGTIGGGQLEARVIAAAPAAFLSRQSQILSFDLSGQDDYSKDMICGGRLEVLLEPIAADPDTLRLFKTFEQALETGERCLLISPLDSEGRAWLGSERNLIRDDGTVFQASSAPRDVLNLIREEAKGARYSLLVSAEGHQFLVEPSLPPGTVYVLGAGHVGQQTAFLASLVGFRTVIMDDREEYANRQRFPRADEIRVLPSFEGCFSGLEINGDSYVVIVTWGHLHDRLVLAEVLKLKAGYIGMIGSKKKRDAIYEALVAEGFRREDMEKVHSPIGLAIGAETPEEIGVSIVSELIKVRSSRS
jgi:xanthine dehydrogenase accessory factor